MKIIALGDFGSPARTENQDVCAAVEAEAADLVVGLGDSDYDDPGLSAPGILLPNAVANQKFFPVPGGEEEGNYVTFEATFSYLPVDSLLAGCGRRMWVKDLGTNGNGDPLVRIVGLNGNVDEPLYGGGWTKETLGIDTVYSAIGAAVKQALEAPASFRIVCLYHTPDMCENDSRSYMALPYGEWGADVLCGGMSHNFQALRGTLGLSWLFVCGHGGGKDSKDLVDFFHNTPHYEGSKVEMASGDTGTLKNELLHLHPDLVRGMHEQYGYLKFTAGTGAEDWLAIQNVTVTAKGSGDTDYQFQRLLRKSPPPAPEPCPNTPPAFDPFSDVTLDPGETVQLGVLARDGDDASQFSILNINVTANPGGGGPPATAAEIDAELNLSQHAGGYFTGVRGANEKYLEGTPVYPGGTGWYVVFDDDTLAEFTGPTGSGTPLRTRTVCSLPSGKPVEPIPGSHADPSILHG